MVERLRWKTHKGERVLIADFFGMQVEKDLNDQAEAATQSILELNKNDLLLLVNVANTLDSKSSQIKFAECAKRLKPCCKKIAVTGLTPVKQAIVGVINKITNLGIRGFATETEACDWLIE